MKAKTPTVVGLVVLPLLIAMLWWIPAGQEPASERQSRLPTERTDAQARPVAPSETNNLTLPTASSMDRQELPASTQRVSYLSVGDADLLGLTAQQRAAFIHVCAETASRLMGQIAIFGGFGRVDSRERMITVNLPAPIASNLEAEFYKQLEVNLGRDTVRRLSEEGGVQARVASALLNFGSQPLAMSFQTQDGDFNTTTRIEWTHVIGDNRNLRASVMLSGSVSKDGFRAIYGPVAERILSGN